MSRINDMSIAETEANYEEYIEEQRTDLRKEGAEELRLGILRELKALESKAWTPQEKIAYEASMIVVERASI